MRNKHRDESNTTAWQGGSRPESRSKARRCPDNEDRPGSKAEARAVEKQKVAARRKELLDGLSEEDKRDMTSFMGLVNAQARKTLQGVVKILRNSGQDPRLLLKKALVHALAHLDIDRCIAFLDTMVKLGQDATLQLLWLYERYSIPNAGGGKTKCAMDHFGRDMGVGKMAEVFGMAENDQEILLRHLADWNPIRKVKVMKAWEATDPSMTTRVLVELVREEEGRGEGPGNLWQCSLCPVKREVEAGARMRRGEHRRNDRTVDAGSLYDYHGEGTGGRREIYSSPHESLFSFTSDCYQQRDDSNLQAEKGDGSRCRTAPYGAGSPDDVEKALPVEDPRAPGQGGGFTAVVAKEYRGGSDTQDLTVEYAGNAFDPRRMCRACTQELRRAIVSSGYDLEIWHTVDHERRALLESQRQNDVRKARWSERERKDRQVSELLRLICEANLDAFSRRSLEDRAEAARETQAAEIRRMLDLKLSNASAAKIGADSDENLRRLNEREATAQAAKLRLKAALDLDRHYASLEPGGLPASRRRRHATSTKPSDFLGDGTPATPHGAMQTFGRAAPPMEDESGDIRRWKESAEGAEVVLRLRQDVRKWQSSHGRRARFSYLCERWVSIASDIEEKQRLKRMAEALEREKRKKEREAAKLLRKLQLAELRATAGSRATGEERRKVERDKEADERKRSEKEEQERMRKEEAAQLAQGDRYWGLVREMQRLRVIEEERRLAWEARIIATKEKMVAVRCISELSGFTHATPPRDPELQQQIDRLMEI